LEDAADRICAEPGPAGGTVSYNWQSAWEESKREILEHASQVWEDVMYDGDLHWAEKFLLLCELPFTFLRKVRTNQQNPGVLLHSCFLLYAAYSQHQHDLT
jgi:hypothetical protein